MHRLAPTVASKSRSALLQSESFAKNVTKGENPDNRDLVTASVAVRYDFSDDWSAQFTWDNYNDNTQLVDLLNTVPPVDPTSKAPTASR